MAFLSRIDRRARHREAGPDLAGRYWQRKQAAGGRCAAGGRQRAGRACSTSRLSPDFAAEPARLSDLREPSANGGSGLALARAGWCATAAGRGCRTSSVLWHDPAGGDGGQFGAIIAFAPDGKSLFLSSGERQRFTPAQDPNQPLGKILHLTLDGKPAPGNPMAGRTGAPVVTITDPPRDTETAKSAERTPVPLAGTEPDSGGDLEQRPSQPLRPRVRRRGAAVGDRNGPARRRRAQPDPAGQELRLAAGVGGTELRRRADPAAFEQPRPRCSPSCSGCRRSRQPVC